MLSLTKQLKRQLKKRQLQKIKAEGRNEADLENFYTALYHAYTAPYLFSDVNGNYKGPDKEIHSVHKHNQYLGYLPGSTSLIHHHPKETGIGYDQFYAQAL